MSIYEALQLILTFGSFVVAFVSLVVAIVYLDNKK
ncbi:putative holin-like toxin [Streptococcus chenjunshii]|uniref:Holin-like toxin n=1 Tax=Streptococcus chenjunshii TaxID=2173853 RepID=A0A372KL99_9STRE|nr:putative holin-like toxin [Streptococcus chenjunshii]AXQ77754.1 putative holin-like toxin [Streptococcus chenjunshii]RFU50476.1 putative holin-like toxin [Streptococcus chenjunshii]RFU52704.1 putative holin-like toxin [Streptococcus chenjunshii]